MLNGVKRVKRMILFWTEKSAFCKKNHFEGSAFCRKKREKRRKWWEPKTEKR